MVHLIVSNRGPSDLVVRPIKAGHKIEFAFLAKKKKKITLAASSTSSPICRGRIQAASGITCGSPAKHRTSPHYLRGIMRVAHII
jgi:hypothetical protein